MVEHLEGLLRTLDPEYDKMEGGMNSKSKSATTPFVESVWSDMTPKPTHTAQSTVMPGTLVDTPHQPPGLPIHTTSTTTPIPGMSLEISEPISMPVPTVPNQEHSSKGKSKKGKQNHKQVESNGQEQTMRMPEATLPSTFEHTAGSKMPEAHVQAQPTDSMPRSASTSAPLMSMPEPNFPSQPGAMTTPGSAISPRQEVPVNMPEAIIPGMATPMPMPNMTVTNTPIPTIGAVVPPSTYNPDSLPAPTWTATQTPRTEDMTRSIAQKKIYDKITAMLELLPLANRDMMSREELAELVMRAIESEGMIKDTEGVEGAREGYHQRDFNSTFLLNPTGMAFQGVAGDQYALPATMTDNEWFQVNGGGLLPSGWTAHFNYDAGLWYFCNYNDFPPSATWQDPRGINVANAMMATPASASIPIALPIPTPAPMTFPSAATLPPMPANLPLSSQPAMPLSRQDADWISSRFGALQAQREVIDDKRGVVSAELHREEKESKELQEAIKSSQNAVMKANEAIAKGDIAKYQSAQEEMIRARGKMDRLTHDARMRQSMIPAAMMNYQGVNRGFDQSYRPRIQYIDERVAHYSQQGIPPGYVNSDPSGFQYPPIGGTTTSFSGRIMGKLMKPKMHHSNYMPTAWPIPPGSKFRASSTPTPYSMPEFCFAWDMLLRSRRDPYAAAAIRY